MEIKSADRGTRRVVLPDRFYLDFSRRRDGRAFCRFCCGARDAQSFSAAGRDRARQLRRGPELFLGRPSFRLETARPVPPLAVWRRGRAALARALQHRLHPVVSFHLWGAQFLGFRNGDERHSRQALSGAEFSRGRAVGGGLYCRSAIFSAMRFARFSAILPARSAWRCWACLSRSPAASGLSIGVQRRRQLRVPPGIKVAAPPVLRTAAHRADHGSTETGVPIVEAPARCRRDRR